MLILFVLAYGLQIQAQDSLSRAFQVNLFQSDILPHSEDIRSLSFSEPRGFSAAYIWQHSRSGNSYAYPLKSRKGFKMQYVNFNYPSKLGSAFSLSAFTEPMIGSNRNLFLSFPIEAGIVGLSKIYHAQQNPENLFFSTPISFYLSAGMQINYKISNLLLLQSALQYQHISNGGIKMPNKGMNFFSYHLGICKYFNEPNWQKSILKKEPLKSKHNWEFYLMATAKTLSPENKLQPMMGFQASYIRSFNHFHFH
ncbi:MAG: acyloxyacyl hydrolase, partial [Bacteroidia bacterium]